MQKTLLIVEDDEDIRELLVFNLGKESYKILEADSGEKALQVVKTTRPDLILLDIMLPKLDGYGVCRELGRSSSTADIPIIMLSAKGEEIDRVLGFEMGVIDYVVKPFSLRELSLRIRSALKRQNVSSAPVLLKNRGIELNKELHKATINGELIELTITEFSILYDLLAHSGIVRTREQILEAAWGHQFEGYNRTVDAHIKRLRQKLASESELLETVRGVGYRLKEA